MNEILVPDYKLDVQVFIWKEFFREWTSISNRDLVACLCWMDNQLQRKYLCIQAKLKVTTGSGVT